MEIMSFRILLDPDKTKRYTPIQQSASNILLCRAWVTRASLNFDVNRRMPIKNQGEAHNRAIPSGIFQVGDAQGGSESKCTVMSCDLTPASCDLVSCQMAIPPTRSDHGHQCTPRSQDLFYTTRFAPKEVQTQENTSQVQLQIILY